MIFSEKLRSLRNDANITAKELAEKIDYTTNTIYDWEKGRCEPPYNILVKLSEIFNVSIPYLLGIEDDFGNIFIDKSKEKLTNEEQTLLSCYRVMSDAEKRAVLDTAKAFAERASVKNKWA